jgi:signal transduction histidine kinase
VKFTDEGEVHLSVELGNGGLRVTIRDTGPGIPPDYLDRIFEPFIQVDASETRTKSGTGLGLTITRELARLLDGSVSVTSEYGRGSDVHRGAACAAGRLTPGEAGLVVSRG